MPKFTRKKAIAVVTTALVLGASGTAFAYWTQAGSGTGTAVSGTAVPVTVQAVTVTDLYPGGPSKTLSGTFKNTNTGPVTVGVVTAVVGIVDKATGATTGTCDPLWYTIAGTATPAKQAIPVGDAQGSWTGLTVQMTNSLTANQDMCKGATVNITYTVAAGV